MRPTFKILFLALLMLAVSFSYWYESINVTVYSKDGVPMKNVPVTIIYQANVCGKHSELKKYTNDSGTVSFSFMNTVDESFGKCIERIYTIRADFGGYSNSTIGDVNKSNKNYQLWLPFIVHTVTVRNAANKSIPNATVTAVNTSYTTDAAGNAFILLPAAAVSEFNVTYKEISTRVSVNPSVRQASYVNIPVYDLRVSVTDENGNPLRGTVRYGNEEKEVVDSYAVFGSFSDTRPTFYVTVNGVTKAIQAVVSAEDLALRYDLTPPIISNVETRVSNNKVYITATVVDGGRYASGISSYPILSYKTNVSSSEGQKMFFVGNDRYETSIALEGDEEIQYTITATDSQGNVANYSDVYYVSFKVEKEIEKATKGFSWLTVVGIFIFAVIVYIIYLKIKEQAQ